MILALYACSDTVVPADTGATADTGDTAGVTWACGMYAPQTVLRSPPGDVSYRSTFDYSSEDYGVGTIIFEGLGTTELDGVETWVHRATGDTLDSTDVRHQWVATTWYVCDTLGLQQHLVEESHTRTEPDGAERVSTGTRVFHTMPIVYPPDLAVGSVWDFHAVYTETHSDGTSLERDETTVRDARTEEEVTVPAGTYTALHIVMTREDGSEDDLYTAREVGTVRSHEMELTLHETFGP